MEAESGNGHFGELEEIVRELIAVLGQNLSLALAARKDMRKSREIHQ
jgi:hypothetical protein